MLDRLQSLVNRMRRLAAHGGGNVAVTFALAVMPIVLASGAAVDFSRMATGKARLQNASDTVALVVAKDIERGKTAAQITADMNAVFSNEMRTADLKSWKATYAYNADTGVVTVDASATVASAVMGLVRIDTLTFKAKSTATFGTDYVEIAFVLDNTGSMNDNNKLSSLKTAATSMIDKLAATQAGKAGRAAVAIVPFGVTVNVGVGYDAATWLGSKKTYQDCYYKWISTSRWGGYYQYTCDTYYSTWTGCVGDRVSPYTTTNEAPVASKPASLYPRDYDYCYNSQMTPLTTDLALAKTKINALVANGATNIPIGAMWGWNMLTPGGIASNAQVASGTKKISRYAIVLTDGLNTGNTLGQSVSQIDANTTAVCSGMKTAGITVFTVRVIDGNETLLKNCATSADYYYDVSNPSALTGVFAKILANITKLRLSS